MKNFITISYCLLLFFLAACNNADKKNKLPEAYDLNEPEKMIMPGNLLEISGISFYKGRPDTVYAIQDEDGKVFRLAWGVKKSYHTKFAKKSDYEDVAIVNEKIFVLKSDGTIFSFPKTETAKNETDSVTEWEGIIPKGEYEGMYGSDSTDQLYIICKSCEADDNYKKVSGYILDVKDSIKLVSDFSIDVTAIQAATKKLKSGFRPAALAKNPVTEEWFILSGSNKLLVVADAYWKVKDAYPLNGNTFNQAEGIAFDGQGNLYISNEGDDGVNGNILLFKRK